MCLAVPMKVITLEGRTAQVEQSGTRIRARIDLLDEVSVGDYVLVHAGLAIAKVDEEDARKTLALLSGAGARGEGSR